MSTSGLGHSSLSATEAPLHRCLAIADFADEQPLGLEVRRRSRQDPRDELQPVAAAGECQTRLVPVTRRAALPSQAR